MEAQIDYTLERATLDDKGNPILDEDGCKVYREVDLTITGDVEPFIPAKISGPPEDCYPAEGGNAYITKIEAHEDNGIVEYDDDFLTPKEIAQVEELLYLAAEGDDSHCDHRL